MHTSTDNQACIRPERLGLSNRFSFRCHSGLPCFTQCCRGIRIPLTPYDILRLKKRLQLSSEDFLALYTEPHLLEKTDLPVVTLRLLDDAQQSCPFVREDGCLVYADRPVTCRYYPLGVAALGHKEGADDADFFFLIKEAHCRGFEENCTWTVADWRKDQAVDIGEAVNAVWTDLMVRKRSIPASVKLTDATKKMFFMASYNQDQFRRFVFESSFLNRYDIPATTIAAIREDELALLHFSVDWLRWILFKEGQFSFKQGATGSK